MSSASYTSYILVAHDRPHIVHSVFVQSEAVVSVRPVYQQLNILTNTEERGIGRCVCVWGGGGGGGL